MRKTLQKKVKQVMAGTLQLEETNEAEMTEDMTEIISALIANSASFVRKYLDHIRDDERVDVTFHGMIVRVKCTKAKRQAFAITYKRNDGKEKDSIILLVEFNVDIIFRDLWLLY